MEALSFRASFGPLPAHFFIYWPVCLSRAVPRPASQSLEQEYTAKGSAAGMQTGVGSIDKGPAPLPATHRETRRMGRLVYGIQRAAPPGGSRGADVNATNIAEPLP